MATMAPELRRRSVSDMQHEAMCRPVVAEWHDGVYTARIWATPPCVYRYTAGRNWFGVPVDRATVIDEGLAVLRVESGDLQSQVLDHPPPRFTADVAETAFAEWLRDWPSRVLGKVVALIRAKVAESDASLPIVNGPFAGELVLLDSPQPGARCRIGGRSMEVQGVFDSEAVVKAMREYRNAHVNPIVVTRSPRHVLFDLG